MTSTAVKASNSSKFPTEDDLLRMLHPLRMPDTVVDPDDKLWNSLEDDLDQEDLVATSPPSFDLIDFSSSLSSSNGKLKKPRVYPTVPPRNKKPTLIGLTANEENGSRPSSSSSSSDFVILNGPLDESDRRSSSHRSPTGLLIDFEEVHPSSSVNHGVVTTRSTSSSSFDECASLPESPQQDNAFILQKPCEAYRIHKNGKIVAEETLSRGSLLVPLKEHTLIEMPSRKRSGPTDVFVKCLTDTHLISVVKSIDMMKLTDDQSIILLPLSPSDRYTIHHDLEKLHFIESLRPGDRVTVKSKEGDKFCMYPGRVRWIGERSKHLGLWYEIEYQPETYDMNTADWASRNVFANASQLYQPERPRTSQYQDYRVPPVAEVRSIPIRRIETTFETNQSVSSKNGANNEMQQQPPSYSGTATSSSSLASSGPYPSLSKFKKPSAPPVDDIANGQNYSQHDAFARDLSSWDGNPQTVNEPLREWRDRPRIDDREKKPRNRQPSNGNQPSRSQSAHMVANAPYERTFSVDDPGRSNGARIGDRCQWFDGQKQQQGTIRFIGHLKGHTNLYAGVEFDDAVGKGTGVFQGEQVFKTPENKAGFVVISSLVLIPREIMRDRGDILMSNKPPDYSAAIGQPQYMPPKYKQNSAESLIEVSKPVMAAIPPVVPPRPAMRAEDYLIDSFSIGSYVEVCHLGTCRSGVVRWLGDAMSDDNDHLERSAVVELDEDIPHGWRLAPASAERNYSRAVIVPSSCLRRDRRMMNIDSNATFENQANARISPTNLYGRNDFGSIDSGIEVNRCEPWKLTEDLLGRMKGIQGHRNSCYLDATLYAMFVQSTAFDCLLERPADKRDIPQYSELVRILATEIVYPLRRFHYVRADHVMKMRELLSDILPNVRGLTSEEKDPEEIMVELFKNIFKAKHFVELINLKDNKRDQMYLCPLIVEDWQSGVATTQHLLERSMRSAGVKFAIPPKTLILQLPRYGQQKVFDKILPLEKIDITSLVNNAVAPCCSCSKPSEGMCPECFLCKRVFLSEVSYCSQCFKKCHAANGEMDHVMRPLYPPGKPAKKPSQHRMTLSAVLCIETSHYVAYIRSLSGRWLFFDSMADREGLSNGFNVPQVKECDRISSWLSSSAWDRLRAADENGHTKAILGKGSDVDPLVNRLLSDSYICFYNEETIPTSASTGNILNNVIQKMVKL